MQISFVLPSRDNLKYLKWSYASIKKNCGNHVVEICILDDASSDGTWEWCNEIAALDPCVKICRNDSGTRWGHTVGYDYIVYKMVTSPVAIIWHADMYLCPGALDEVEKLMHDQVDASKNTSEPYIPLIITNPDGSWNYLPKYKTIVSLTRIEPPLHPDGPEKYLADWGTEPEDFNETAFLQWFSSPKADGYKPKYDPPYTKGIFAPWAFFVEDFKEVGGHDPIFRPQSKEDSDIFNRFMLNGCTFVQTWLGCTYHMTCRGSRFNPTLTSVGVSSPEWVEQNRISSRNFIRKWGRFVNHDAYMHPIVAPKYDIGIVCTHCTPRLMDLLELYCSSINVDLPGEVIEGYVKSQATDYDILSKFSDNIRNDIILYIDGNTFTDEDAFYLYNIADLISSSGLQGVDMEVGNIRLRIGTMTPIPDKELIYLTTDKERYLDTYCTNVVSGPNNTNR